MGCVVLFGGTEGVNHLAYFPVIELTDQRNIDCYGVAQNRCISLFVSNPSGEGGPLSRNDRKRSLKIVSPLSHDWRHDLVGTMNGGLPGSENAKDNGE